MCKNPEDLRATAVATYDEDQKRDLTCFEVNGYLTTRTHEIPGFSWKNADCTVLAPRSTGAEGTARDAVARYLDWWGPACCGSLDKTQCGGAQGNMCENPKDFLPDKVVHAATPTEPARTCNEMNSHYGTFMSKSWNELTCKDIGDTSWTDDDGKSVEAFAIVGGYSRECCNGKTRCSVTSSGQCTGTVRMNGAGSDIANGEYKRITQESAEAHGFPATVFEWHDEGEAATGSRQRLTMVYQHRNATNPASPTAPRLYIIHLECTSFASKAALRSGHGGVDGDCNKWMVVELGKAPMYWKHTIYDPRVSDTSPPPKDVAWEIPGNHTIGVLPVPHTECISGSGGATNTSSGGTANHLIAQLRALLDRLSHDAEVVGPLHLKLAELEAAAAGCNHVNSGAVASVGPIEPLTCSGAAAGTGEVQFLPVSEMFKPNLEGRLADIKAKGGQMCFCR
jgi:hypothetical protein